MTELLAAATVTKRYGGVPVLSRVDISLFAGEVHALIGENGAGKSTLIRLLTGSAQPDEGEIRFGGRPVRLSSPADARRNGVVAIFQELAIVPELSVAENIVLGSSPEGGWLERQFFARSAVNKRAAAVLEPLVGDAIDPAAIAGRLSTAERQIVEIARALAIDAPVIIMDEPTASLSPREAEALLRIIKRLRDDGKAILFVSHRLNEVCELANRITVLRGGELVKTFEATDTRPADLIELMIGRPIETLFPERSSNIGDVVLKARGLTRKGVFSNVSFELRRGEVLGFAGLVGAGRTEIMRALFGLDRLDAGTVEIDGRTVSFTSPKEAIDAGLAFVTEDRKQDGLVLPMDGRENIVLAAPSKAGSGTIVRRSRIREMTERLRRELSIRGSLDIASVGLSGGNQQKLILGRWMLAGSRILILDEPTRGIDVGAKAEVYRLIHELAQQGASILLVSSELPEVMNVAHRLLVISGGKIEAEMDAVDFDEKKILHAAFRAHLGQASEAREEIAS
jgi:ABC-type sugar transport system ATPase subunit